MEWILTLLFCTGDSGVPLDSGLFPAISLDGTQGHLSVSVGYHLVAEFRIVYGHVIFVGPADRFEDMSFHLRWSQFQLPPGTPLLLQRIWGSIPMLVPVGDRLMATADPRATRERREGMTTGIGRVLEEDAVFEGGSEAGHAGWWW